MGVQDALLLVVAPVILLPAFLLLFAGFWVFIVRMIAFMGWSRLAERYAAAREPAADAARLRGCSIAIGSWSVGPSYRSCMNAWMDQSGLYLRPNLLFRFFHPLLLIGWRDMQSIEERGVSLFRHAVVRLAGDVPELSLHGRLGAAVIERWRQAGLSPQSRGIR